MATEFPSEEKAKQLIHQRLARYLEFAERLLRFWLDADKDTGLERSPLAPIVRRVAFAMNVRACRQFRSTIELCTRGEAVDASIIARSMFETAAVMAFVLRPRFVPRKFNSEGKTVGRISIAGFPLTREFRATLYVAHQALAPERFVGRHKKRPGMKRITSRIDALLRKIGSSTAMLPQIGQGWTDVLMNNPFTYSGLSIGNLARSLGKPFPQWYDHVYGKQSEHVHPADVSHLIEVDEEGTTTPQWHSSAEDVRGTLLTAIAMFYSNIGLLDAYVGFGGHMHTALAAFSREYHSLITG